MPKTKIVCTIGPSSESAEMIRNLITAGMNVARLNFSHGTHEEHKEKISTIRSISGEIGRPVAILQDLCGPKIRVGKVAESGIRLEPGQSFILTNMDVEGSVERVSVSYENLPLEVKTGDIILLSDGLMELAVDHTSPTEIHCTVITGGVLTSHKGINLPTGTITADALTEKDRKDLQFGLANNVDYIALSFVREAEDILKVKSLIEKEEKTIPVIAKIEKHEALDNIDDIITVSDGIMVARGDLGVEIPLENVPGIQAMLVNKANAAGKPVIVATQMLRSMVNSPRPTRAEATDVANGVMDGADAVMLSEETAMQISRFKPRPKLIVLSPDETTIRRLCLYWGCMPSLVPEAKDTDERIENAALSALETGLVQKNDTVVITSGHPAWVKGTTNMLRVKKL